MTSRDVALRRPALADMALRQRWLADTSFMAYNRGWAPADDRYDPLTGCVSFPDADWPAWYERWVAAGSDRDYWFVEDGHGIPVGHAHYRLVVADVERGGESDVVEAHVGVGILPTRRGEGLGLAALRLLLGEVRSDGRAAVVVNEFEDSRVAAARTHSALGFRRAASVGSAPDGSAGARW